MNTDDLSIRAHWQRIYADKASTELSWYQAVPARSVELIDRTGVAKSGAILDVGGGDSRFVDELLARGFTNVTVLDLSGAALDRARRRLGATANSVTWLECNVLTLTLPAASVDLWHDRAAFHFLVDQSDRATYVAKVRSAVRPGGYVIVATFAEGAPQRCSGLPVHRYSADGIHHEFGAGFRVTESARETHHTPGGADQHFTYCVCRYEP